MLFSQVCAMNVQLMNEKMSIWQILFYVSWAVLTLWLILKITGVINTPVWLEYGVPIGSVILGIFGLYHNLVETINKVVIGLAHIEKDFEVLKTDVGTLKTDVGTLKTDVGTLKTDVGTLKTDVGTLKIDVHILKTGKKY